MPSPDRPRLVHLIRKGLCPTRPATLLGKLSQPIEHVLSICCWEPTAPTCRALLLHCCSGGAWWPLVRCCSGSAWWPLGDGAKAKLSHCPALAGLLAVSLGSTPSVGPWLTWVSTLVSVACPGLWICACQSTPPSCLGPGELTPVHKH